MTPRWPKFDVKNRFTESLFDGLRLPNAINFSVLEYRELELEKRKFSSRDRQAFRRAEIKDPKNTNYEKIITVEIELIDSNYYLKYFPEYRDNKFTFGKISKEQFEKLLSDYRNEAEERLGKTMRMDRVILRITVNQPCAYNRYHIALTEHKDLSSGKTLYERTLFGGREELLDLAPSSIYTLKRSAKLLNNFDKKEIAAENFLEFVNDTIKVMQELIFLSAMDIAEAKRKKCIDLCAEIMKNERAAESMDIVCELLANDPGYTYYGIKPIEY